MYCGKFEDVMPFNKQEQDMWINRIKQALEESESKDHSYTNFEICALRTIKALQQEIEQLKSKRLSKACKLCEEYEQENEQLQAQVAMMWEAIQSFMDKADILTGSNERLIAEDSIYWKFKKLISTMPADYHNPADVEALKMAKEEMECIVAGSWLPGPKARAQKILAAIEQIGGGEK